MLTPTQLKRAVRLYDKYQCDTREYRELAKSAGWNTGELNRHIWRIKHAERQGNEINR